MLNHFAPPPPLENHLKAVRLSELKQGTEFYLEKRKGVKCRKIRLQGYDSTKCIIANSEFFFSPSKVVYIDGN